MLITKSQHQFYLSIHRVIARVNNSGGIVSNSAQTCTKQVKIVSIISFLCSVSVQSPHYFVGVSIFTCLIESLSILHNHFIQVYTELPPLLLTLVHTLSAYTFKQQYCCHINMIYVPQPYDLGRHHGQYIHIYTYNYSIQIYTYRKALLFFSIYIIKTHIYIFFEQFIQSGSNSVIYPISRIPSPLYL